MLYGGRLKFLILTLGRLLLTLSKYTLFCSILLLSACGEVDEPEITAAPPTAGEATNEKADGMDEPIPDADPNGLHRTLNAARPVKAISIDIRHPHRGDLRLSITTPSGREFVLHDRADRGADDLQIHWEVPVDEQAAGVWTLHIWDLARHDVGALRSWALETQEFEPGCGECAAGTRCEEVEVYCFQAPCPPMWACLPIEPETPEDNPSIPDNDPFGVTLIEQASGPVERVWIDIRHSYRGDLRVSVTSPDGLEHLLHDRVGGAADDLHLAWAVPASSQLSGRWTLQIADLSPADTGSLEGWHLEVSTSGGGSGDEDRWGSTEPGPCHGRCWYGARCTDFCPAPASCSQSPEEGYWQVYNCTWE